MTRALILHAHPCAESFSAALNATVHKTLAARGWQIDGCDLYAERFDPVLSAEERRAYHTVPDNAEPVAAHVERLRAAQALVLVFPVWNSGFPAILKGFLDRVFLPGVSFRLEDGRVQPNLRHIGRLAAVTTYGGTRLQSFLLGDAPRKVVTRSLARLCAKGTRARYLALYDLNRATDARRRGFLGRVETAMRAL